MNVSTSVLLYCSDNHCKSIETAIGPKV